MDPEDPPAPSPSSRVTTLEAKLLQQQQQMGEMRRHYETTLQRQVVHFEDRIQAEAARVNEEKLNLLHLLESLSPQQQQQQQQQQQLGDPRRIDQLLLELADHLAVTSEAAPEAEALQVLRKHEATLFKGFYLSQKSRMHQQPQAHGYQAEKEEEEELELGLEGLGLEDEEQAPQLEQLQHDLPPYGQYEGIPPFGGVAEQHHHQQQEEGEEEDQADWEEHQRYYQRQLEPLEDFPEIGPDPDALRLPEGIAHEFGCHQNDHHHHCHHHHHHEDYPGFEYHRYENGSEAPQPPPSGRGAAELVGMSIQQISLVEFCRGVCGRHALSAPVAASLERLQNLGFSAVLIGGKAGEGSSSLLEAVILSVMVNGTNPFHQFLANPVTGFAKNAPWLRDWRFLLQRGHGGVTVVKLLERALETFQNAMERVFTAKDKQQKIQVALSLLNNDETGSTLIEAVKFLMLERASALAELALQGLAPEWAGIFLSVKLSPFSPEAYMKEVLNGLGHGVVLDETDLQLLGDALSGRIEPFRLLKEDLGDFFGVQNDNKQAIPLLTADNVNYQALV